VQVKGTTNILIARKSLYIAEFILQKLKSRLAGLARAVTAAIGPFCWWIPPDSPSRTTLYTPCTACYSCVTRIGLYCCTYAYLGHPSGKTALPFVVSITVQVGIEQDEIDVPLQQIETSLLRALFLFSWCRLLHLYAPDTDTIRNENTKDSQLSLIYREKKQKRERKELETKPNTAQQIRPVCSQCWGRKGVYNECHHGDQCVKSFDGQCSRDTFTVTTYLLGQ